MSKSLPDDGSSTTQQLLADAANDYDQASAWREPAFQKLADTTRQDQAAEAREDRRAAR